LLPPSSGRFALHGATTQKTAIFLVLGVLMPGNKGTHWNIVVSVILNTEEIVTGRFVPVALLP
jgi:hypothetical protein